MYNVLKEIMEVIALTEEVQRFSETIFNVLGKNIQRIREKRQYTYLELQQRSGYSRQYISLLESGKKDVRLSTVVRIAQALNVSLVQLVSRGFDSGRERPDEDFINDDFLLVFNTNVRRTLRAANKKEADICQKIDMDPETLSRILTHKIQNPRLSTLAKIATGVDTDLNELLCRNEGGNNTL